MSNLSSLLPRHPARLSYALLMFVAVMLAGPSDVRFVEAAPDPGPIPVGRQDASWGRADAPVTLVHFSDMQCPYCAKIHPTIEALKKLYGPKRLRVVFKHLPLAFHKRARPAAEAGEAVRMLRGDGAFWSYLKEAFANAKSPTMWQDAVKAGTTLSTSRVQRVIDAGKPAKKVSADLALAKRIGARGTPTSYVNGVKLSGAQPVAKFEKLIDEQLKVAATLRATGVAAGQIYAKLSKTNFKQPQPTGTSSRRKPADTTTVWKIPVGKSPFKGPATALVTIVEVSDFQCPFCKRVNPTLKQLMTKYKGQIRIVFKHNPLPFHKRAEPAAELAIEALKQRGNKGFWDAHDRLFAQQKNLEDADLEQIARDMGLNVARVKAAIKHRKHRKIIEADQDLASDFNARGTPHFFINGRRLIGAQPVSKFSAIIDEEIKRAKQVLAKGVSKRRLYGALIKNGKTPPPPPKKNVPAATRQNPSLGTRHAKVTIQMFTDFQCPFCSRAVATLKKIEKNYRGRVRLVFRNLPLPFHKDAPEAHATALEAFRQKGNRGFWKMYELLFANQRSLKRADLLGYGGQIGLDIAKLERALDTGAHQKRIDADKKIAKTAGIRGTPAFVINGYFLSGAQPYSKFKKLVERALRGK